MVTPRDQIVQYSTQIQYSTNTTPTYLSILNDIDYRITNVVPSSDKIRWLNDAVRENWKFMASTSIATSTSVAGQAMYAGSTDMRFDKISYVGMSDSTARSSTELYTEYAKAGQDDALSGNSYYKAGGGIGLFPVPTSNEEVRAIKIIYEPLPTVYASTTDTTTVPKINLDYTGVITTRVVRDIARAGNNPDVELANNYDNEYREQQGKMRMDYYKRKQKNKRDTYPHSEHYWNG